MQEDGIAESDDEDDVTEEIVDIEDLGKLTGQLVRPKVHRVHSKTTGQA